MYLTPKVQLSSPLKACLCQLGGSLFWDSILCRFKTGIPAPPLPSLHNIAVIWKSHRTADGVSLYSHKSPFFCQEGDASAAGRHFH